MISTAESGINPQVVIRWLPQPRNPGNLVFYLCGQDDSAVYVDGQRCRDLLDTFLAHGNLPVWIYHELWAQVVWTEAV